MWSIKRSTDTFSKLKLVLNKAAKLFFKDFKINWKKMWPKLSVSAFRTWVCISKCPIK